MENNEKTDSSKITAYLTSPGKKNCMENDKSDSKCFTPCKVELNSNSFATPCSDRKGINKTGKPVMTVNSPRARMNRKKKLIETGLDNKLLTDYFPVRRSCRKPKSEIEKEKRAELEEKILNNVEEGLEVATLGEKGRGVVATRKFLRGDFVVEYAGDLIDLSTAKQREKEYSENPQFGCYMYYFVHKNRHYCIDATAESGRLGRLINHSKTSGNCHTKLTEINARPYLMLMASRDISVGEELLYDYGDRKKESLESHPWLKF
ncbi:N-lysine methyltransferase KMT5A-like [Saccostrea cucullata]|uniref:N-lysine methyltransferase KMT5A-like n=1 Tax=Saccostrea cuccullata TaxID=36930 RepID=UPI002ED362B4